MQKRKILIVDDEIDISNLATYRLEANGFDVQQAYNGKEALEKVKIYQPDLILLDVLMPVMNGYETTQLLKTDQQTKNIPLIAFTAACETAIGRQCMSSADDVVIKPYSDEELIQKIENLI